MNLGLTNAQAALFAAVESSKGFNYSDDRIRRVADENLKWLNNNTDKE